ncbi:DUF6796 family protein [Methyloprofundus sp.]|uniref:DUF6796 family protein n=1 Tax=Methyloprofundus sp. TaxID=2020875 RepID=UPI003D09DBE1
MNDYLAKLKFGYRFYIYLGILGSILVGIGEYLLHFSPLGPAGEIDMLLNVPLARARTGHFFAIAGVPFYFAGYYGLLKLFRSSNEFYAKCLFVSGTLSFTVGGIWISSRYFGAVVLQKAINGPNYDYFFSQYDENYQILVWALRILVALLSLFYVLSVLKNNFNLPKWLAIFNPIVLLGLIISTLFWLKPVGIHIAPIAMNMTHFIFFSLLLIFAKPSKPID